MEIGCVTSFEAAEKHRGIIEYTEETVGRFLMPSEDDATFSATLRSAAESGMPIPAVCCFVPGTIKSVGSDMNMNMFSEWAETVFSRARRAGIGIVVYGSGSSRKIPDGFPHREARNQFEEVLKTVGDQAEIYGLTVVLEPLNRNETNLVNSLAQGEEIVRRVSHPRIKLLADIYHMAVEGEPADAILQCGDSIEHVHCAEPEQRAAPGTSGFNFVPYLKALKKTGYDRRISIECRWNDMDTQMEGAVEYLKNQIKQAGYE